MALVVARQKNNGEPVDVADPERRGRLAPRAIDALLAHILEAWQIVDPRAADNPQHRLSHDPLAQPSIADAHVEHGPNPMAMMLIVGLEVRRAGVEQPDRPLLPKTKRHAVGRQSEDPV